MPASRRDFLKQTSLGGAALFTPTATPNTQDGLFPVALTAEPPARPADALDLSPARWLWYPLSRSLPNTVVLFRKELNVAGPLRSATGFLLADSRYHLFVNGQRVQFGPAPSDPRWPEADPVELAPYLKPGRNVVGVQVLYYGHGEGTWPIGRPGLLLNVALEAENGQKQNVVTDGTWQTHLARSWRPGQYKRWYLRAFQEEFDARRYPYGWTEPGYVADANTWLAADVRPGAAHKPALSTGPPDPQLDLYGDIPNTWFTARSVPLVQENLVPTTDLAESLTLRWLRPVDDYFDVNVAGAYEPIRNSPARAEGDGWTVAVPAAGQSVALTFRFREQAVGFPYFTIDAPAGTIVELLVQEAHAVGGAPLLNTKFNAWTRFICREGLNRFETFDYESLRWVQLNIREHTRPVRISAVGMRRRQYPWPNPPALRCSDAKIQRVLEACVNTLHNSAQETIVDGMARERQQYSGDCGHQLHAIHYTFGDTLLYRRFANTYAMGQMHEGYFLDCWPAFDRLARLIERQLNISEWGPLLDHGIGFNFDCWYYYLYTADKEGLAATFPRLVKFFQYIRSIITPEGLLPVEGIGVPSVWIDHSAYAQQRHKQLAFTLYAVAAFRHALAPLARVFGNANVAQQAETVATTLQRAAVKHFWDAGRGLFVNNKPWLAEEKQPRFCDRSLATAVLFDLVPGGRSAPAVTMLADAPATLGLSYPANAGWRYWALAKAGRVQPILDDFRTRWYGIESVVENNTLAEWWTVKPDSGQQWSHCPVIPLFVLFMDVAGIRPTTPGAKRIDIRPQLGDLERLTLTARLASGPVTFDAQGRPGNRQLSLTIPPNVAADLILPASENVALPKRGTMAGELVRYTLPAGQTTTLMLKA